MNEDYRAGLKLLKDFLLRNHDFNLYKAIHANKRAWVLRVSRFLAKQNACEKFWRNVLNNSQDKILKEPNGFSKITSARYTFSWSKSEEKMVFWLRVMDYVLSNYRQQYKCG